MKKSKKAAKGLREAKKTAKKGPLSDEIDSSAQTFVIADPWAQLRSVTLESLLLAGWWNSRSPLGGKLSPQEEWKRLTEISTHGREVVFVGSQAHAVLSASTPETFRLAIATETMTDQDGSDNIIEAKIDSSDFGDVAPIERMTFRGDNLPFRTTSMACHRLLAAGLISLDVSSTGLDNTGLDSVACWTPWLRELISKGNQLDRVPCLKGLGKLQALDLSYNQIAVLDCESFPAELGASMRRLNLEGNRLERLTAQNVYSESKSPALKKEEGGVVDSCALHTLPSLLELNLSANKLDDPECSFALITRAAFPRLATLNFVDNPLLPEHESNEVVRISKGLPTLTTINGQQVSKKTMALPAKELLSTQDQSVQEGRSAESCSCIEGNPCVVAYHCRDWPNRFKVATAAAESRP